MERSVESNRTHPLSVVGGIAIAISMVFAAAAVAQKAHGSKSSSNNSSDPTESGGRSPLRQIVQGQCVVNWQEHHNPAPCERVFLANLKSGTSGYAVLAAPGGGAHYLLVPTQTMEGTESSELLDPDAPNYFAEAWHARGSVGKYVGHEVPRTAFGLAIGMAVSRAEGQFHINIECLQQDAFKALHASADAFMEAWSPITIAGSTYQARRLMGEGLDEANVFELLATLSPEARRHMGNYTLVVAGMQFKSGPGFVLLTGTGPSGEILLDSTCSLAGGGG
jgi:CDP-diacylglycerol pyrophosphatase